MDASVADMRFVKPLDRQLVLRLAGSHELLVTVERQCYRRRCRHGGKVRCVHKTVHTPRFCISVFQITLSGMLAAANS